MDDSPQSCKESVMTEEPLSIQVRITCLQDTFICRNHHHITKASSSVVDIFTQSLKILVKWLWGSSISLPLQSIGLKNPFIRLSGDDGGGRSRDKIYTLVSLWKGKQILHFCHTTKSQLCRIYEYILLRQENGHQRKSATCSHIWRTGWESYLSMPLLLTCGVTPLRKTN